MKVYIKMEKIVLKFGDIKIKNNFTNIIKPISIKNIDFKVVVSISNKVSFH